MYQNDQVTRRYSEAFKLKILAELSTGKNFKRRLNNSRKLLSREILNTWFMIHISK
ncbi:MAG: hypothetical protein M0R37_10115 [Bacteroidales bacterium]|nr:hypothetical protein [Bacteroidales bacterium]